jgi:hypothetical protein
VVALVIEVAEGLKRATSAAGAAQVIEVVGEPKRATSAVEVAGTVPWVEPEEGEASVLPVIEARRAGALHPAAQEVSAVAVHPVVGGPEVVEVPVAAVVVGVAAEDAGKQNRDIKAYDWMMTKDMKDLKIELT